MEAGLVISRTSESSIASLRQKIVGKPEGQTTWQVKALVGQSDDSSLVCGSHMVAREVTPQNCSLTSTGTLQLSVSLSLSWIRSLLALAARPLHLHSLTAERPSRKMVASLCSSNNQLMEIRQMSPTGGGNWELK